MNSIEKLIKAVKGNKVLSIGTILGILFIVFALGIFAGACLIFGLNLMGFTIPYTLKTMLGGAIVISCMRPVGTSSEK
jgi:hypothetical protein